MGPNLHNIVSGIISAVNPMLAGQWFLSSGYTTDENFKRAPAYSDPILIRAQVQSLTYRDLMQLDGLNLNGEKRALYVSGHLEAVLRPDSKGGDLITLDDGTKWLVAQVLENWYHTNGWVKVAVTRQLAS